MKLTRVLLTLMRIAGTVQVILGIGFWTGHWYGAVPVHMTNGILFICLLWALAVIALVQRRAVGLALFAIVWGVAIAMLGFTQTGILAGSEWHWVVRVVHLAIGIAAMPIGERLVGGRREKKAGAFAVPA
jgi:hypothetical protein